jgi:hypothetical protein
MSPTPTIALTTMVIDSSSPERRSAAAASPIIAPMTATTSANGAADVPNQAAPHAVAAIGTIRRSGD